MLRLVKELNYKKIYYLYSKLINYLSILGYKICLCNLKTIYIQFALPKQAYTSARTILSLKNKGFYIKNANYYSTIFICKNIYSFLIASIFYTIDLLQVTLKNRISVQRQKYSRLFIALQFNTLLDNCASFTIQVDFYNIIFIEAISTCKFCRVDKYKIRKYKELV